MLFFQTAYHPLTKEKLSPLDSGFSKKRANPLAPLFLWMDSVSIDLEVNPKSVKFWMIMFSKLFFLYDWLSHKPRTYDLIKQ